MKNGTCIKCGSKDVYTTTNGAQYSLGIGNGRAILEFQNYLCMNCGYLETYFNFDPPPELTEKITNEKKRMKIQEMYQKTFSDRIQQIKEDWVKVKNNS